LEVLIDQGNRQPSSPRHSPAVTIAEVDTHNISQEVEADS
jgi:hypothetical protein